MAYEAVPQGVAIVLHWNIDTSILAVNALHARNINAVPIDQALANAVDTTVKSAFTSSAYVASFPPSTSLQHVAVRDISSTLPLGEFLGNGAPRPGTGGVTLLPPNLALCLSLRTANAGRSFRGRFYGGGFSSDVLDTSTGHATAPLQTSIKAFVDALNAQLRSNHNLQLAIVSRQYNKQPLHPPALRDVVTTVLVDSKFDHVDRRKQ